MSICLTARLSFYILLASKSYSYLWKPKTGQGGNLKFYRGAASPVLSLIPSSLISSISSAFNFCTTGFTWLVPYLHGTVASLNLLAFGLCFHLKLYLLWIYKKNMRILRNADFRGQLDHSTSGIEPCFTKDWMISIPLQGTKRTIQLINNKLTRPAILK